VLRKTKKTVTYIDRCIDHMNAEDCPRCIDCIAHESAAVSQFMIRRIEFAIDRLIVRSTYSKMEFIRACRACYRPICIKYWVASIRAILVVVNFVIKRNRVRIFWASCISFSRFFFFDRKQSNKISEDSAAKDGNKTLRKLNGVRILKFLCSISVSSKQIYIRYAI